MKSLISRSIFLWTRLPATTVLLCSETKTLQDTFLHVLFDLNEALESFIRKYETKQSVTIFDYELTKENISSTYYTAGVVRLNFTFQRGEEHFSSSVIFKVPQLGVLKTHSEILSLYAKEKYMYESVIPLMYEGWTGDKVVPEFYGASELGVLVLENLREYKYHQKKNGALLEASVCGVALESLAQFHALSLKHLANVQKGLDALTVADKNVTEWSSRIYPSIVAKLKKHVLPLTSEHTQKSFDKFLDEFNNLTKLELAANESGFNVLLHGDLHYYNVFFKENREKNTKECKLIDFQWSRRGPPILDIMVYLTTSISPKDFRTYYRTLFTSYMNALHSTMEEIDSGTTCPYGLDELIRDFEKYKLYFMYHVSCYVPLFWAGQFDLHSVEEVNEIDRVMSSPEYCSFFTGWSDFLLPAKSKIDESQLEDTPMFEDTS